MSSIAAPPAATPIVRNPAVESAGRVSRPARLLDERGGLIACVTTFPDRLAIGIVPEGSEARSRLLGYYFGLGRRMVLLEEGGARVRGRLDTSWNGRHREWKVLMGESAAG